MVISDKAPLYVLKMMSNELSLKYLEGLSVVCGLKINIFCTKNNINLNLILVKRTKGLITILSLDDKLVIYIIIIIIPLRKTIISI